MRLGHIAVHIDFTENELSQLLFFSNSFSTNPVHSNIIIHKVFCFIIISGEGGGDLGRKRNARFYTDFGLWDYVGGVL